jgi:hypothetical protein
MSTHSCHMSMAGKMLLASGSSSAAFRAGSRSVELGGRAGHRNSGRTVGSSGVLFCALRPSVQQHAPCMMKTMHLIECLQGQHDCWGGG